MAFFKSGNPTLSEKVFDKNISLPGEESMTARGAIQKFGFLLFMVFGGAAYTWHLYYSGQPSQMRTLMFVGMFGGLVLALITIFKQKLAPYIAPVYGIMQGLFLGAISAMINDAFAASYPGIVLQAVGLTFGVAFAVYLLYSFRIIKATQRFKSIIMSATLGIGLFYLIALGLRFFGVDMPFMYNASPLGIGISVFVCIIAALNLILDFDMIEKGQQMNAPKYMEWYGAFSLLVTIVWLYIEILKLLSRLASSRS